MRPLRLARRPRSYIEIRPRSPLKPFSLLHTYTPHCIQVQQTTKTISENLRPIFPPYIDSDRIYCLRNVRVSFSATTKIKYPFYTCPKSEGLETMMKADVRTISGTPQVEIYRNTKVSLTKSRRIACSLHVVGIDPTQLREDHIFKQKICFCYNVCV